MRETAALLLTLLAALPAEAGLRGRCRRMCRPEVARCHLAGFTRASCRRTLRAECIAGGATGCVFVPPTTTTTTTLPPPQCHTDADCQDANLCNGLEACVAGTCVAGSPALCSNGVPALWLGTATSASGGYVNIGATLCAVGAALTGQFACEPGTNSCLATQGTITGTIAGSDAYYPRVTFPDGSYCNFDGQVSGLTLSGTYTCYGPSGFIVYDQGTYSLARCPSTSTTTSSTSTTSTTLPDTTAPELLDFSLSATSVDTTAGPATVTVRIEAQDDLSGFGSGSTGNGWIDVRHTSGANPVGWGSLPITGGTLLHPIFELTLTFPQFSPAGSYPIMLGLRDNVFNSATFSSADLAGRGFPSEIVVMPP